MDRYSANPSMYQSGGFTIARFCNPAPARPREKMSKVNTCTISWMSTCSKLAQSPLKNCAMR